MCGPRAGLEADSSKFKSQLHGGTGQVAELLRTAYKVG